MRFVVHWAATNLLAVYLAVRLQILRNISGDEGDGRGWIGSGDSGTCFQWGLDAERLCSWRWAVGGGATEGWLAKV